MNSTAAAAAAAAAATASAAAADAAGVPSPFLSSMPLLGDDVADAGLAGQQPHQRSAHQASTPNSTPGRLGTPRLSWAPELQSQGSDAVQRGWQDARARAAAGFTWSNSAPQVTTGGALPPAEALAGAAAAALAAAATPPPLHLKASWLAWRGATAAAAGRSCPARKSVRQAASAPTRQGWQSRRAQEAHARHLCRCWSVRRPAHGLQGRRSWLPGAVRAAVAPGSVARPRRCWTQPRCCGRRSALAPPWTWIVWRRRRRQRQAVPRKRRPCLAPIWAAHRPRGRSTHSPAWRLALCCPCHRHGRQHTQPAWPLAWQLRSMHRAAATSGRRSRRTCGDGCCLLPRLTAGQGRA